MLTTSVEAGNTRANFYLTYDTTIIDAMITFPGDQLPDPSLEFYRNFYFYYTILKYIPCSFVN